MDEHDPTIPWHARLTLQWTEAQATTMAFIRSQVQNPADAEDVLQQTALVIASKFHEYDSTRPFVAWAIGIARLKVLEYHRAKKGTRVMLSEAAVNVVARQYAEQAQELSDRSIALQECLKRLNAKSHQLIGMRYEYGMAVQDIAQKFGTSASVISVTLSRVRTLLKQCITKRLAEGDPR